MRSVTEIRAEPGGGIATHDGTTAGSLRAKAQLIDEARALARAADRSTGPKQLNRVLIEWARTGPAGLEHDGRLWWELKEACATFYERCSTARLSQLGVHDDFRARYKRARIATPPLATAEESE